MTQAHPLPAVAGVRPVPPLHDAGEDALSIAIEDNGIGLPQDRERIVEPYVTTRPGAEGSRTGHIGMGLGFFIAKTLLERTGAAVDFRNGRRGGAVVSARWPRSALEAPGYTGV